ncbi:hypothetical protein TrST_g1300 [Triparma strigata]|uniref:PDZ domain-containing protein n=1 Tax=Triparma strigata TaxID=1606541 RepID=A0A9W7BD98_9STRA|nr:hypothetical protein TrST_g1300 [Triparma strigata]
MPFSDSEYSDSTDSTMYSGGSSDLDETSHHGQRHAKGSPTIGREFTSHGMNRGDDLDSSYSKNSYSSKKWNRIQSFPEPTYNVVLASNIKFLGINLDMNRVFGKKVIEVKGAALKAGVQEGDLLMEVNGHVIKGDIDIKSLFNTEVDSFNSFRFIRTAVLKTMKTSRLRKVFPVATEEELTVLINEVEERDMLKKSGHGGAGDGGRGGGRAGGRAGGGSVGQQRGVGLIVEIEPDDSVDSAAGYFSTLLDQNGDEITGDTKKYATWGGGGAGRVGRTFYNVH